VQVHDSLAAFHTEIQPRHTWALSTRGTQKTPCCVCP
jgi:hypothetical protein